MKKCCRPDSQSSSRREFLYSVGGGLGSLALAQLLGRDSVLADGKYAPKPELTAGFITAPK
jgi:hypothetical protein